MSISMVERLRHIEQEARFLMDAQAEHSRDEAEADRYVRRAIIRSLEVIGEAAKNLPEEFLNAHPEIEWRKVGSMRDRLIHGYFGVHWETVWNVLTDHVPTLLKVVHTAIEDMSDQAS